MNAGRDVRAAACHFQIRGEFRGAQRNNIGHINDTYCAAFDQQGRRVRYLVQRINHHIFKDPVALMENIQRVTAHLGRKVAGEPEPGRRVLTLIPARDGRAFHRDEAGNYWRSYAFIEKARTFDTVKSAAQAFEAAKAFGRFQKLLSDLPAPRLRVTIPGFHQTPVRFAALERVLAADAVNRARLAKPEIEFALRRKGMTGVLVAAGLPERITHNDTKLNNVLFDDDSGEAICVIDLDTVMPGLAAYDFGDMVRTTTSPALEDERDLSQVKMRFPLFEALIRGYLASAGDFLTQSEKQHLAFSARLITFETGVRFLTDFLAGDTYFKVHRPGHNLDRCRTQFRLVESIEEQEERMNRFVEGF